MTSQSRIEFWRSGVERYLTRWCRGPSFGPSALRVRRREGRRTLLVETCEPRELLAVFTVTSPLDTGAVGELRWAVTRANTTPGADEIEFAAQVQQIQLRLGELTLTDSVAIRGRATIADRIEIAAAANSRLFRVDDSNPATSLDVSLTNVTLTGGDVTPLGRLGGAILNAEDLTLVRTSVLGNRATHGGGVANYGTLRLWSTQWVGNVASQDGGGVWNGPGSSMLSHGGVIRENLALAGAGGGVSFRPDSAGNLQQGFISGNSAGRSGGGVDAQGGVQLELVGMEISDNRFAANTLSLAHGGGLAADGGAQVTIRSSAIVSNNLVSPTGLRTLGGGIYVGDGARLQLENSRVHQNGASFGGGIHAGLSDSADPSTAQRSQLDLLDSTIDSNFAGQSGGGLFVHPHVTLYSKCTNFTGNSAGQAGGAIILASESGPHDIVADLRDSTISANRASQVAGGIAAVGSVRLTIDNSIVSNNLSEHLGGGLYVVGVPAGSGAAALTQVRMSLISGNNVGELDAASSTEHHGGGLWAGPRSVVQVDATTIEGNRAARAGGGLAIQEARAFVLTNSTVAGNFSGQGAGVWLSDSAGTFLQSTFHANQARVDGGGFYIQSTIPANIDIRHSTLSLNSAALFGAGRGGGVYLGGQPLDRARLQLDHTIVSTNLGPPLGGFDEIFVAATTASSPALTARYSLLRDHTGSGLLPGNPDPQGNLIGTLNAPIDAQLQPLGDNGGPTLTMLPEPHSPVWNAGDPQFPAPPAYDQRREPFQRVAFGRIDMGSVEVQPPPPTPDFNDDGVADCADIDALVFAIGAQTHPHELDLTGDGRVDRADLAKWLDDAPQFNGLAITRYLWGDANLDSVVDGSDFNIWNANKFTAQASWCHGDFNADGRVDASDFNVWNAHKFQRSPLPTGCGLFLASGAAPSPSSADGALEAMQHPRERGDRPPWLVPVQGQLPGISAPSGIHRDVRLMPLILQDEIDAQQAVRPIDLALAAWESWPRRQGTTK